MIGRNRKKESFSIHFFSASRFTFLRLGERGAANQARIFLPMPTRASKTNSKLSANRIAAAPLFSRP